MKKFTTLLLNIFLTLNLFTHPIYSTCYKALPKAIVIGVKKSGTYALLRYLNLNPNIRSALKMNGARLNEMHYFDRDENYQKGIDWYREQMPPICNESDRGAQVVVEKTPGYFKNPLAPKRIFDYDANVKLILIVRNPLKRLISELTHCDSRQKFLKLERKCANSSATFEEFFRHNRSEAQLLDNKFVRNSVYYLDLLNWSKYFKLNEQILVLDGENFIKTPWIELNKLETYLLGRNGRSISRRNFYFNREKKFYCLRENNKRFQNLTHTIVNLSEMNSNRCLGKNKGRKSHIFLSDFVRKKLDDFFLKWNNLFFNLIGKKFDW